VLHYRLHGSDDRGFTLVEVIVSLATLAIGFALVWGLHFASLRMAMSAQRRGIAIEKASASLERLRSVSTSCPGFNGTSSGVANFYTCASSVTTPAYSWQRVATVTVSWNEKRRTAAGTKQEITIPNSVTLSALYVQ
jgi:prepilin-type N-terminal cleavage/methylation domain-containing protein